MGHGDLLFNIEINGGSMNPLSPNQILRILENGYFMTHQEQSEAAQYIRQLQQAVLDEREACAKIIEDYVEEGLMDGHALRAAKTIRARGNHEH